MKALIISVASMIIIITGWGFFVNYSDRTLHELTNLIEKDILESVYSEDWGRADSQMESLSKQWHRQKKIYTFFYNTTDINATDYSIAKAKNYIKANDLALAAGELSCVKEQLGFLHLNELITLDNIF